MSVEVLNGVRLKSMFENGYRNLKLNMSTVDDLNVFPVPDGDTGKNMTMTIEGGVNAKVDENDPVSSVMRSISKGSLLSARGNSGVILSQFIRGLADGAEDLNDFNPQTFVAAMQSGVKRAYGAVLTPVEGTMLTVMRESAEYASERAFEDFDACLEAIVSEMKRSLKRTPELLAVLKEANVVDSGGAGLLLIFEGMLKELRGELVETTDAPLQASVFSLDSYDEDTLLVYGYCTEFILQLQSSKTNVDNFDVNEFIASIEPLGDSIVAVRDGNLVKVHIHSFEPEKVIAYARTLGEFITIKIENMSVQHNETVSPAKKEKVKYAVVASAMGEGIIEYFKEIGASAVVDGGRTNNPSAGDFIEAFRGLNAEHIIVLPNDSNIILAAEQAASLFEGADVRVVKTKSIAEGYSALSMMDLSRDSVEEVIEEMECYRYVTTGYVSVATRDANIDSVDIKEGEYLGFTNDCIYASEKDKISAALALFDRIPDMEEKQVVTVFVGSNSTEEETEAIENALTEKMPLIEFGVINGGQDVYDYIFAIE